MIDLDAQQERALPLLEDLRDGETWRAVLGCLDAEIRSAQDEASTVSLDDPAFERKMAFAQGKVEGMRDMADLPKRWAKSIVSDIDARRHAAGLAGAGVRPDDGARTINDVTGVIEE